MQKTYYHASPELLKQAFEIGRLLGQIKQQARGDYKTPRAQVQHLRAILQLEGDSLSTEQLTAIQNNGPVIGPAEAIAKAERSLEVYRRIHELDVHREQDLIRAYAVLTDADTAEYRSDVPTQSDATVKYALPTLPPPEQVAQRMRELFEYLRSDQDHIIIKSCVFHFELICIQPFAMHNERMGRLWQSLALQHYDSVFKAISLPTLVEQQEGDYFTALHQSTCNGLCTPFIEFWLLTLRKALQMHLKERKATVPQDFAKRLGAYEKLLRGPSFSKADYATQYDSLPLSTVQQDLQRGEQLGYIQQQADGKYIFV